MLAPWLGRNKRKFYIGISFIMSLLIFLLSSSTHPMPILEGSAILDQHLPELLSGTMKNKTSALQRGGGFLTTHSGCRIAKWIYTIEKNTHFTNECISESRQKSKRELKNASQLQNGDTLFVPHSALNQFVSEILDDVKSNIVIMSGRTHAIGGATNGTINKLLNHSHVMHWFCQNLPIFGGENPHHPKVSPFPYGLKETGENGRNIFMRYKRIFFKSLMNSSETTKDKSIYAGPLSMTSSARHGIPHSGGVPPEDFFRNMAQHHYILSPDGDRPDCYRHYEAIGLGTMPITQLDPILYRHLEYGPVIFNNSNWDLQKLKDELDPHPVVNRNLIWEAYWIDWIDGIVGASLNWNVEERNHDKFIEFAQGVTGLYSL